MINTILPYIQIVLSVLLIGAILLQQSSGGAGGAFGDGGDNTSRHTRRGAEKILFNITIVLAIIFSMSIFLTLII